MEFCDNDVDQEKVEAVDLLEESWFFDNLFDRKARMMRCFSDPCPSSNFGQEMLVKNSCSASQDSGFGLSKLVLEPTNQCLLQAPKDDQEREETEQPLRHHLLKSPSLPTGFGKVVQEKESRRRMIKSTKQQSPKSSDVLPPRHALKISSPRREQEEEEKESDFSLSKLIQQSTIQDLQQSPTQESDSKQPQRRSLLRSPSLPSGFGREKPIQEKESARRMSKSRQPSPSSSDGLPPRRASKGMTQSYSIPRYQPSRNTEAEIINEDSIKEMRRRYLNHSKSRKNLTDFEDQEVQGFKDLGFKFEKQDLNPIVVNILPGLQEKNRENDSEKDKVITRPYLSDEWLVQSYGPKIPHWGAKKSPEDMKAQIKFWARAVASNVH